MYRQRRGKLLEEYHDNVQRMDDYKWSVYTTWTISFKRLGRQSATFLQLCAFLHHDGISERIFQSAASKIISYVPRFPDGGQGSDSMKRAKGFLGMFGTLESLWDSEKFFRMIKELLSNSLIEFDTENQTYSIHPLVHAWIRTTIPNEKANRACAQWILGMSTEGEDSVDHTFRRTLQAHVDSTLEGGNVAGPEVARLFALVYHEGSRWEEEEALALQVKEASFRVLGPEHPDTLTIMANLASTYSNQGRWMEAAELELQVKEASFRVLGPEHPDTLRSMANLALTYSDQGRWAEAEELQLQVKEASLRVLGAEHPVTLTSMANLASTYSNQGRWKEAVELELQVKEIRLRVLGPEHPVTLMSMANLASMYSAQGRWKEAEELELQVKEGHLRMLGPEHPDTLRSMANLALTYSAQGRWTEAAGLELQVKEARG